jgi:hypothetical protein
MPVDGMAVSRFLAQPFERAIRFALGAEDFQSYL